jgi:hypothetical protein
MNHHQRNPTFFQDFHTAFILQQLAKGSSQGQWHDTAVLKNGSGSATTRTSVLEVEPNASSTRTTRPSTSSSNNNISSTQDVSHRVAATSTTSTRTRRSRTVSPPATTRNPTVALGELEVATSTTRGSEHNWSTKCLTLPIRPLHAPPKLQRFPLHTTNTTTTSSSISNALLKKMQHDERSRVTANRRISSRAVLRPILPSVDTNGAAGTNNHGQQLSSLPSTVSIPRGRAISISEMTSMDHSSGNQKCKQQDLLDIQRNQRRPCKMEGCPRETTTHRSVYCPLHFGQRRCDFQKCHKFAQGRTRFCIAHGGGRRCKVSGCTKAARDRWFCAAHGGGKRCKVGSCTRLVVGRAGHTCTWHRKNRSCPNNEGRCEQSVQPTLRCNNDEEKLEDTFVPVLCTEIAKGVK